MILTADYHTHTKYSHGKGTVMENSLEAEKQGLKEIAISDHGFGHPAFGLTKRKLPNIFSDVKDADEKLNVRVLLGIESNILTETGRTDLPEKLYKYFDVFQAGIHKFVKYGFKEIFDLFLPNLFTGIFNGKPSKSLIKRTTNTYINTIKNNPVDVITHLNFGCYADVVEVAKCARDYGTYIELNAKKTHLSDEELVAVANTGVHFVIGSDAHSVDRIG